MKTRTPTTARRVLLAATTLALATSSHAAIVIWGAPQNISGDSDVSTVGTLFGPAINYGGTGVGNTKVNGVTFSASTGPGSSNGFGAAVAPFISLSAPYQTLLSSANTGLTSLTISPFVTSQAYQIEFWVNNSSVNSSSNTVVTNGNSVTLSSNTSATIGGLGQYVLGTFVADASGSQAFNFSGTRFVSGYQIRQIPEPGTALLLALGVCASGVLRRRRGE